MRSSAPLFSWSTTRHTYIAVLYSSVSVMLKTLSHWSKTFKYTSLFHRQVLKPHTFWDQIGLNGSTRWSLILIQGPRGSHGTIGSVWWVFWWSIRQICLYKVIQIYLLGRGVPGSTWKPCVTKKHFDNILLDIFTITVTEIFTKFLDMLFVRTLYFKDQQNIVKIENDSLLQKRNIWDQFW